METVIIKNQERVANAKEILSDVWMKITWREIAHNHFGKSSSWLYHKMDGNDGAGGKGGFTPDEITTLKGALCDLSDRLRKAADRL